MLRILALAGLALLGSAHPSAARIHGAMYCWALDSELPVSCGDFEDEEEEEARPGFRGQSRARNPIPITPPLYHRRSAKPVIG